jgi:probable F420-dependent oxidoreductase
MPNVSYTATIDVARATVWDFVQDINNWAPFARGYQEHEIINDRESVWLVKGDIGPISRVTKFHVQITEWLERERVAFVLKGLNESVTGEGAILLIDSSEGSGTEIRGDAAIEFGGSLGPAINHLFVPWLRAGADELVTKIAVALQPDYQRPEQPFFLVRWIRAFGRLLRRLASAGGRAGGRDALPEPGSGSVAAPVTVAGGEVDVGPNTSTVPLRVETLLLGPSIEQYSGGGAPVMGLDGIATAARRIEELGFDGVTTPEAGHDPFLPLMIAAEHTSRISLGTNVAIAFPRSPMVVAQIAWDLQRFAGGRFRLGLGTQVKGHNERRYSAPWTGPPGPRLREYLLCLKAIFQTFQSGDRPSFAGKHYQFTLMSPFFNPGPNETPHVPIYIAALNTYMARLAGELCDGLRLHPLGTFAYTREVVLPAVEAGARKAGRQLADIDIVASPFLITGKNEAEVQAAKAGVRQQVAFYASTRTYHGVLQFHGWGDVGMQLHGLSLEGKWVEMLNLITDDMLAHFAVVGTYEELVPKLKESWGKISNTIFLGLPPQLWQDEALLSEIVRALHQP